MLSCAHNEYMLTYMPFACCDMPLASVSVSAAEVGRLLPLYEEGSTAPPKSYTQSKETQNHALYPMETPIWRRDKHHKRR